MATISWQKQSSDSPLFQDVFWSRPETKSRRGKLLIIGGSRHGFSAPAGAYAAALASAVGSVRVILPNVLKKSLGASFFEAEFAPTTQSGGLARTGLGLLLENAEWADGVLLAGEFGRNSETAVLLESFAQKYRGQLSFTGDSLEFFLQPKSSLLGRKSSVLVGDLGQLQKLAKNNRPEVAILHSMNLQELVQALGEWTRDAQTSIVTRHAGSYVVAAGGKLSTTPSSENSNWQVELAACAAVWWLQQPQKPFETLTSAVHDFSFRSN